jgi:succinyl-CoA synthetase beta subunit
VVRLQGTNKELGMQILNDSSLNIVTADGLDDAAQQAVLAVKS